MGRNSDSWSDTHNPLFADAEALTAFRTEAGSTPWAEPRESGRQPDPYMDAGHAAENIADHLGISRAEMDDEVDEFAVPVGPRGWHAQPWRRGSGRRTACRCDARPGRGRTRAR
ncbi:hypothetical protein GCM10010446_06660 [Streptomyces enissocaesilis]|uniref:Uncharacterized protein n=1 Tax=Streptomyces enissocaesilis TaxID=332589 RepID=A0ABN3WSC9_9ACTN